MRDRSSTVDSGGPADVIYVLCLMQIAFLLLGGVGEQLMMGGNPAYLVLPVAKVVLLFVLATKAVTGRRWALVTLMILQSLTVAGFVLQLGAGLLPMVDFSVNLMVLLTNLAMPVAVFWLCVVLLRRPGPATVALPVPQDPYAAVPTEVVR
jgi:hypothetical protein